MDGHGHLLARMDQTENPLRDHLFAADGDNWRLVADYDATADKGADITGVADDGTALVRFGQDGNGVRALNRIELKNGATSVLFSNPKYDAGWPISDPWNDRVIGGAYTDDKVEIQYFDPNCRRYKRD